tara:strand:+ start:73722 stop:74993 length:1272 start_codon:yes stop_codon:yes gene_type:complete
MIAFSTQGFSQCDAPSTIFASNVNYYNAEVNWNTTSGTYFYRIRFKIIGAPSWSYKNNIDSTLNKLILIDLLPLSDYIWQIKSYCDTTNTNTSSWSTTDTFTTITNTCPNTNVLFTSNINFNNAVANWDTINGANRYKIRYKILGTTLWSYLGPVYHPLDSITIPVLQQNTSYEWQVLTFHDSTNLLGSLWSESDTFTTTSFVYSPFNPLVTNTLSSLECSSPSEFSLTVTQSAYEPDIGTSRITSDGGYFDISSISMGDSVGFAIMTTTTQNITAVLRAGLIAGQNYAIINSYDSTGSLIGFFTIENDNGGIKVTTTTPNDNNDYTSGYISEVYLTNLFINPPNSGPLHFFIDIESELSDQIYDTDTVQIWCNTNNIIEQKYEKEILELYDLLGRKRQNKQKNKPILYMYDDGTVQRKIIIE